MDRNGQVRKEPTLADLEAFEQLLRESLQTPPAAATARPVETAAPAAAPPASPSPARHPDEAAMAELARLIETPVDFITDVPPAPTPVAVQPVEHTSGHATAQMTSGWQVQPEVVATRFTPPVEPAPVSAPAAAPPPQPAGEALDPLAAFEEELRRFDTARLRSQTAAPIEDPVIADLQPAYPAEAAQVELPPAPAAHPAYAPESAGYEPAPSMENWQHQAYEPQEEPAVSPAEASLKATEDRLAQEAAAAAVKAGVVHNVGRSKGIFLAMGGIAAAGLAIVGGSFLFGSSPKTTKSGDVPVIAAKTQPAKEKPADPGGVEIPNQNKEVLAARTRTEVKPAQVVNNTEQPLDLNQATKRDSVRVVAPNPYQSNAPAAEAARTAPASEPQPGASGPGVEPRRVTSVRIPIAGAAPAVPAVSAPAVSAPAIAVPTTSTPAPVPTPVPAPVPPQRAAAVPDAPVKVESRPVTANSVPRAETTPAAPPPARVAPPAPKAEPRRSANAPLSLSPNAAPTRSNAPSGGSGWAIQLASRPTEADAKNAAGQLKSRYSSAIGARSPIVVSGEANGKTVYRVRVTGFDQAGAGAACQKVKAAGGGCFVTRQ